MAFPTVLLGIVISTLLGAVFHFWRGGNLGKLLIYLILAWIGFWGGHLVGNQIGWTIGKLGQLQLGMACIGALITLMIGHWLSLVERNES
jgi:hypothetical protein